MHDNPRILASLAPSRRRMLHGMGGVALSHLALSHRLLAGPLFGVNPFTLGVASGEPTTDGFVIWTRVAPRPLEPSGGVEPAAVEVRWTVAEHPSMTPSVQTGVAMASPMTGHAVHVEVGGLLPGREYFYWFEVAGHRSTQGRAKTLPLAGKEGQIRFASAGCQRYEDGLFTAWRHMARERLDFVVHYGDYIYEYKAITPEAKIERAKPVVRDMPGTPGKCITLEDFRNRYAIYKLDADLQAAHAAACFVMSFDDHEVENDWAGLVSGKTTPAAFRRRRQAAFQAWYEHMPLRAAQMPRGPDISAYRRLVIGQLLQLDILDTRQYRSPQPCSGGWEPCPDARATDRTLLGRRQEDWLESGFRTNTAQWSVLAQQVPFARLSRGQIDGAPIVSTDKWDGAEAARTRLCEAAVAANLKNLIVLSGDVHENRASEIRRDFDNAASKNVGVEFVATSISTEGNGIDRPKRVDPLMSENPHLKFLNAQRGYVRHTADRKQWRADFMVLDTVTTADGKPSRRASFVVEPGSKRLGGA